eukprot:COSAG06_NODE_43104_length_375_cov_0.731884_1_plen_76_part_01
MVRPEPVLADDRGSYEGESGEENGIFSHLICMTSPDHLCKMVAKQNRDKWTAGRVNDEESFAKQFAKRFAKRLRNG